LEIQLACVEVNEREKQTPTAELKLLLFNFKNKWRFYWLLERDLG